MIIFNELRIDALGKNLIIDVSVDTHSYFNDMTIEYIKIDTDKTFKTSDEPSDKAINVSLIDPSDIQPIESSVGLKRVRRCISAKELGVDLTKSLLFVFVKEKGVPAPNTPCNFDRLMYMQTVAYLIPLYNSIISKIKELGDTCNIPKGLIDSILRFKALELSIKTGNYDRAIKLWNRLFSETNVIIPPNNCCNGNN